MYSVDKSVPMPKLRKGTIYPFATMAVGDSFFVDNTDKKRIGTIRACASVFGKKHNMKFSCKCVDSGVRVWRIA